MISSALSASGATRLIAVEGSSRPRAGPLGRESGTAIAVARPAAVSHALVACDPDLGRVAVRPCPGALRVENDPIAGFRTRGKV